MPRGSTLHVPRPGGDDLLVAFVRMGGESLPWGVAWSFGGLKPRALTVPEPRDRELVGAMMAEFSNVILPHAGHPGFGDPLEDGQVPPPILGAESHPPVDVPLRGHRLRERS